LKEIGIDSELEIKITGGHYKIVMCCTDAIHVFKNHWEYRINDENMIDEEYSIKFETWEERIKYCYKEIYLDIESDNNDDICWHKGS
jgi:hypothetical protein